MNTSLDWRLLKKLYSIHSPSGKEERLIAFLVSYLRSLPGIVLGRDAYGNLYAKKGETQSYPCIAAHLDQVQRNHSKDFRAIETRDIIFGYSPRNNTFEGLGADDKNGIFIALEALKNCDCLKAVFFKEEETGCHGSSHCNMTFFDDCRFVIECDRKGSSDLITSIGCTDLCSEEFIHAITSENYGYIETTGMMTDVEALKENGLPISAINLSCGYHNPHTDEEITVKQELLKCWRFVQHIIEDCTETYHHEAGNYGYYDDWELEEEIHAYLSNDPGLTADDLYYMYHTNFYYMYHTNFPRLRREDFQRIVEEHRIFYEFEEDTTNQNFRPDEKEEDNTKEGN